MKRQIALALVASFVAIVAGACAKDSPVSPTPPPTPTTVSGTVTVVGGARVPNATVKIFDGANAGKSTLTNASGEFLIDGLTPGNANVTANATIYDEVVIGAFLNGPTVISFIFPIPACQTQNTGSIGFGNRSATATQTNVWDGVTHSTIGPGANSATLTAAAGIAHSLRTYIAGTNRLACSDAFPVLTQCERGRVISCSGS